ncbi:hypothetical protein C8J56DRAFT_1059594 [Mycena floridula]|nr:hypothetical protein C8J56DRAFT_1068109 [Mycena floridula]KAJ7578738.1 hypothetical protein C8J56DRAFT_1059594 [Mycena floridula]
MSSNSTDCSPTIPSAILCVPLRDSSLAHRPTCPPRCLLTIGFDHDQLRQLSKSFSARSIQTLPIEVPAQSITILVQEVPTPLRLLGCTSKSRPEQAQDEGQARVPQRIVEPMSSRAEGYAVHIPLVVK